MYHIETRRPHLLPILIAGIGLAGAGLFPITQPDIADQLIAGRDLATNGTPSLIAFFPFNWDGTEQWHHRYWLSDLWLWKLYQLGGLHLLIVSKTLLLGLAGILLVWRAGMVQRAEWLCSAIIVWAIPACRMQLTVKPHLIGYIFTAFLIFGVFRLTVTKPGRERLFWFTSLFGMQIVWINLHSSALLALIIVAVHLVIYLWYPEERKCLFRLILLLGIASCLTPWGPSLIANVFHHLKEGPLTQIPKELSCMTSDDLGVYIASIGIATLLFVLGIRANLRAGLIGWASVSVAFILFTSSFISLRFMPYALIVASPFVAEGISIAFSRLAPRIKLVTRWVVLCSAIVVVPKVSMALPPYRSIDWTAFNAVLFSAVSEQLPHFSKTFLAIPVEKDTLSDVSTNDREDLENDKSDPDEEKISTKPIQGFHDKETRDFCREFLGLE